MVKLCRIFGYLGNEVITSEILTNVSLSQIKGGPDQQSIKRGEDWAIGNNRLAIVDLQGGQQPYVLGEHIQVVFNGEIYNHNELRNRLQEKGYLFQDTCDGSILPALYKEYGESFVKHLDGMFAVAIIDTRKETKLILATDSSGMKSLYYYWNSSSKSLYFSSEIPSLLEFEKIPKTLWMPGVDAYLTTKIIFGEETMFKNIFSIPPASLMIMQVNEEPRKVSYQTEIQPLGHSEQRNDPRKLLYELLSEEVETLLEADVAVTTINSGGLDSSFITAIASKYNNQINSFNISYIGDWPFDEKIYAREVAQHCKTIHHEVKIDPREFQSIIPLVIRHLGQPNADPITLSTYSLFEAINKAGFKVALSGDGADEIFAGYDRFVNALNTNDADWMKDYIESLAAINEENRWNLYSEDYKTLISKNGKASVDIERKLEKSNDNRLKAILDFEQNYRLPSYHLRRVDHLSMAHSIEVRMPFCQTRVIHFANNLSENQKIMDGQVKKSLYEAAQGHLPDSVLNRKKQPFTLPINAMMRPGLPLYIYIQEILNEDVIKKQNIFNMHQINILLDRQSTQPDDQTALALWSLMIFQVWLDTFNVKIDYIEENILQGVLL
jgi:asparagine synthase (glutamine-hydrolysing)